MKFRFSLTDEELENCRKFSEGSAPTQREYRSGGTLKRSIAEVSGNTFRGKVAEVIAKKFLEQDYLGFKGINLDFNIYPRGRWDEGDIKLGKFSISIKSSKSFAKWLLIEKKDIEREDNSDFYISVLVDKSFNVGEVKGFASKEDVVNIGGHTLLLSKGEFIPGTRTEIDANNHGIKIDDLKNSENDWKEFKSTIKSAN